MDHGPWTIVTIELRMRKINETKSSSTMTTNETIWSMKGQYHSYGIPDRRDRDGGLNPG